MNDSKITVKLEVVQDKDTGLTMNHFTWFAEGKANLIMELANRPAVYRGINKHGSPVLSVLAWDKEVDLPLAEQQRVSMEAVLNENLWKTN